MGFINSTAIRYIYPTSTISDILRYRVDSLAQWLEHKISAPGVLGSNLIRNMRLFKLYFISQLEFHYCKMF